MPNYTSFSRLLVQELQGLGGLELGQELPFLNRKKKITEIFLKHVPGLLSSLSQGVAPILQM